MVYPFFTHAPQGLAIRRTATQSRRDAYEHADCLLYTVAANFIASDGEGVGERLRGMREDITCNSHRPWDRGWSADVWISTKDSRQTLSALLGHGVVVMSETGIGAASGGGWESIREFGWRGTRVNVGWEFLSFLSRPF